MRDALCPQAAPRPVGELGKHTESCGPIRRGHQWTWAPGMVAKKKRAQSCPFGQFQEGTPEMGLEGRGDSF